MSAESAKKIESTFFDAKMQKYVVNDWGDLFFKSTSSQKLLYFFLKCSEQFLASQDDTHSCVVHGLVKSQLSTTAKAKCLKILLIRGVKTNHFDDNGKTVLEYLIEINDSECIEVLLKHGNHQDVQVSEKCLLTSFHSRNQQRKGFKLLFTYAVKHNIAPQLTGMSDGDTFLHKIILHEKNLVPFKEWLGYFLSIPEINVNAIDRNNCTAFDLLFLNYNEKKRCEYAVKLLIKYRFPNATVNDCLELPRFPLNQIIARENFKREMLTTKKVFSMSKFRRAKSPDDVTDNEFSGWSHKYLKLKTLAASLSSKMPFIPKKSSQTSQIRLPNEETDLVFEVKITNAILQEEETKSTQKSKTETVKLKKYLSSEEAVTYNTSMLSKPLKVVFRQPSPPRFNDNLKGLEEKRPDDRLITQLPQELSVVLNATDNNLLHYKYVHLSECKKMGRGSYGVMYNAVCNGQPCVAKGNHPFIAEDSNKQFLKEINILSSLKHLNIVQFLGVHYHRNTPLLVIEKMWLSLCKWLQSNPSSSLHDKVHILIDVANGLRYLHSQNIIHCNLVANNILLSMSLQAKICDFGLADEIGKIITALPDNPSHMPPEICIPNQIYTKELDIFSFGCMMIHTITEEFPNVNNDSKGTEIDRRSKYLKKLKGLAYIYFLILACLQDNPSHRPSAKQCKWMLAKCLKIMPNILLMANGLCLRSSFPYDPPTPVIHNCDIKRQSKMMIPVSGKFLYTSPDLWTPNQWLSCITNSLFHGEIPKTQTISSIVSILNNLDNFQGHTYVNTRSIMLLKKPVKDIHCYNEIFCPGTIATTQRKRAVLLVTVGSNVIKVTVTVQETVASYSLQLTISMKQKVYPDSNEIVQLMKVKEKMFERMHEFQSLKATKFHTFILNIQQGKCASLPSELLNYMYLAYHAISCTVKLSKISSITFSNADVTQPMENVPTPLIATSKIPIKPTEEPAGYSQLVLCANSTAYLSANSTAYLTHEVNEIKTEEAIQEENLTLSDTCDILLPSISLLSNGHFSQFLADDTHERDVELAASKLESSIVCLNCVPEELKVWIFASLTTEIKKAFLPIPLDAKYCRYYSFTELLKHGLWQFIREQNNFQLKELFTILHKVIIIPIMEHFKSLGVSKLSQCTLIPQGVMRLVPFHSLLNVHNEEFFGELTVLSSVSILLEMVRNKARDKPIKVPGKKGSFLVVGNPTFLSQQHLKPLRNADREARFIANVLRTIPVLRQQATKKEILLRIKLAKIIHLATHRCRHLAFSGTSKYGVTDLDWKLLPSEIETLNLLTVLVVLSCCGSEKSQCDMMDAFISAGAPCVISSFWKVGDESACIFMQFLYQLLITGLSSSQAFKITMKFLKLSEHFDFVFWGGFHIVGNTRLHKSITAQFPIQRLLGETSIFPRFIVYDIEDSVLMDKDSDRDVQVCVNITYNVCLACFLATSGIT